MKKFQVLGIGNAIVDVLTRVDSAFVEKLGIEQGITQLVDRERAETLYSAMDNRTEAAGALISTQKWTCRGLVTHLSLQYRLVKMT